MSLENLKTAFIEIFKDAGLKLKDNFNGVDLVDPDYELIIDFTAFEQTCAAVEDYHITIDFKGQIFLSEDKDKTKIRELFSKTQRVLKSLKPGDIRSIPYVNTIEEKSKEQAVGWLFNSAGFDYDEDVNVFQITFDLYVCDFEF